METAKPTKVGKYVVALAALVLAFLIWNNQIFAGTPPTNIGIKNGRLTACPATPNCVNSQGSANDGQKIAPIEFGKNDSQPIATLKQIIEVMPRTKIIKQTTNYLYVEFASKLMGFVDDVEFYLDDSGNTVQVRSASRLGESDLGVNRQRIEEIRSRSVSGRESALMS